MSQTRVVSRYAAIIDGRSTGLAGCNNADCDRKCLRRDPGLERVRDLHKPFGSFCGHFIPTGTQTASDAAE